MDDILGGKPVPFHHLPGADPEPAGNRPDIVPFLDLVVHAGLLGGFLGLGLLRVSHVRDVQLGSDLQGLVFAQAVGVDQGGQTETEALGNIPEGIPGLDGIVGSLAGDAPR